MGSLIAAESLATSANLTHFAEPMSRKDFSVVFFLFFCVSFGCFLENNIFLENFEEFLQVD